MYRTSDPRFRRRLNELGQTLESANETAQSSIYIFGTTYVQPCLSSIGSCITNCVDVSCPNLNLSQRERLRRQRAGGRGRGGAAASRAELSFDFYDDWDDDDNDGLLGWGNDEFDRLVGAGGGSNAGGYGTVSGTSSQPTRQRGMNYQPKASKRKSIEGTSDPTLIAKNTSFFGKLFGGKALRYQPSAADLQDHPGTLRLGRDITEGEALLEEIDEDGFDRRRSRRARSGTVGSEDTRDSYSSRGDLFPSDEEDDAVPLDDEFAMVLERRMTGSGPETEESSGRSRSEQDLRRPHARSRASTRRTFSSRSSNSGRKTRSRTSSGPRDHSIDFDANEIAQGEVVPPMSELKLEERQLEQEQEAEVERRRQEAHSLALERGLLNDGQPRDEGSVQNQAFILSNAEPKAQASASKPEGPESTIEGPATDDNQELASQPVSDHVPSPS